MSAFLERTNSKELVMLAADIRKRYNTARERLCNDAKRYYNQSIASTYYSEEMLISEATECGKLKAQYLEICNVLKSRGLRATVSDDWVYDDGSRLHIETLV